MNNQYLIAIFVNNIKPHLVHAHQLDLLINDLKQRFPGEVELDKAVTTDTYVWDPGGMFMMDSGTYHFKYLDLDLRVSFQHFEYFVDYIQTLKPREFSDKTPYYKLHGAWNCIVLPPEHFNRIKNEAILVLPKLMPSIEYENKQFDQKIAEINKDQVRIVTPKRGK